MIANIDIIRQLQAEPYDPKKNNDDIMRLYRFILENCSDKEAFIKESAPILEGINADCLSETDEKNWLVYAGNLFSSLLVVWIYEQGVDIWKKEENISNEEFLKLLNYFMEGNFSNEIFALGLYACAQLKAVSDPMLCYDLTKKAFTAYPHLSTQLNVNYCFQGEAAIEHLTKECPFCGSTGNDLIPYFCYPQVLKLNNNSTFPPAKLWMKCNRCQNYFTYNFPLPDVDIINGHYTKENENVLSNRFSLSIYNNIFCCLKEMTDGTNYLEIGIGNGEMLAVAQEFGYNVDAVEICREDCERVATMLDINIKWCDFVDYQTDKKYDVIIMGDVFEHVSKPMTVLKKAGNLLKDQGVLWLSTPNYNCAYARMEKLSHRMWQELNHYTYVSYESLSRLLRQLDLEAVHYRISERYIGSMEVFIKKR